MRKLFTDCTVGVGAHLHSQGNDLANKFGAEAFWPMSLDKESDKAAAILRTFTRDGFQVKSRDRKGNNTKSFVKIPSSVLQQAQGLAIFTVFRTGLHLSGASGSGILIARQPDGSKCLVEHPYLHFHIVHRLWSSFGHSIAYGRNWILDRHRHIRHSPRAPNERGSRCFYASKSIHWRRIVSCCGTFWFWGCP